jgi:hypothetical protein
MGHEGAASHPYLVLISEIIPEVHAALVRDDVASRFSHIPP